MTSPVGVLQLVTLHVRDYETSLKFYGDTLGLKLVDKVEPVKWAQFEVAPGVTLGIHADASEPGARAPGGSSGFYFTVPDVDAAVAELERRGVKITEKPADKPYGRDAYFEDPSGNEIALVQPSG